MTRMSGRRSGQGKAGALLLLVAVFVAGGLSGAAVIRRLASDDSAVPAAGRNPRAPGSEGRRGGGGFGRSDQFVTLMVRRLDLNEEQRDSIERIVRSGERRTREVFEELRPQIDEGMRETEREIRELLTAEQAAEYDRIRAEARDRFQRRGTGRGGAPGPGGPPGPDSNPLR